MARANNVRLSGIVNNIKIKVGANAEELVARLALITVRRSYMNDNGKYKGEVRTDQQIVVCRDSFIIKNFITKIKKGDRVDVKGSLVSRDISKKFICPSCNTLNIYEGSQMIYVDPMHIRVTSTGRTQEEEWEDLRRDGEISNDVIIFGNLCNDPLYYNDGRKETCQFLMAADRKRHIQADGPDKRTDFLPVIAYGKNCKEYTQVLHTGSEIYIDGAIQTREFEIHRICESCGCEITAPMSTSEIVPYSIEYVHECNFPDKKD